MEKNDIEIWQAIPGYEGLYEASSLGNVRSLNYRHTGKTEVLKPKHNGKGYLNLGLCKKDEERKNLYIHRLVFSAFNGPIPPGMTVDHVNGDKLDNRLENLQLLSNADNARKGNLGRTSVWKGKKLSADHCSKISAANKGKKHKPHTEETKAKMSAALKGRKHSSETRAKISATHKARYQREKN